jgi:hypothetical protein
MANQEPSSKVFVRPILHHNEAAPPPKAPLNARKTALPSTKQSKTSPSKHQPAKQPAKQSSKEPLKQKSTNQQLQRDAQQPRVRAHERPSKTSPYRGILKPRFSGVAKIDLKAKHTAVPAKTSKTNVSHNALKLKSPFTTPRKPRTPAKHQHFSPRKEPKEPDHPLFVHFGGQ